MWSPCEHNCNPYRSILLKSRRRRGLVSLRALLIFSPFCFVASKSNVLVAATNFRIVVRVSVARPKIPRKFRVSRETSAMPSTFFGENSPTWTDMSDYLVHFTKPYKGKDAYANMLSIQLGSKSNPGDGGIINANQKNVALYLCTINMLWSLGLKDIGSQRRRRSRNRALATITLGEECTPHLWTEVGRNSIRKHLPTVLVAFGLFPQYSGHRVVVRPI